MGAGIAWMRLNCDNTMVKKSKLRQLKIDAHGCRKLKQSFGANGYDERETTYIVTSNSGGIVHSKGVLVESWVEPASKVLASHPIDRSSRVV